MTCSPRVFYRDIQLLYAIRTFAQMEKARAPHITDSPVSRRSSRWEPKVFASRASEGNLSMYIVNYARPGRYEGGRRVGGGGKPLQRLNIKRKKKKTAGEMVSD